MKKLVNEKTRRARHSKTKGRRFEIYIARMFGRWIGDENCLWHTIGSGSFKGQSKFHTGDICPQVGIDLGTWPFTIEVKKRENINFTKTIFSSPKEIEEYWNQCIQDSQISQTIPLLILCKNRMPAILGILKTHWISDTSLESITRAVIKLNRSWVYFLLLEDFLSHTNPKDYGIILKK